MPISRSRPIWSDVSSACATTVAPTTDDRLRLTVLVARDVAPIRGLVLGPDGRPGEPFEGWMELTGLIESARMRDRDQG